MEISYLNGKYIPGDEVNISADDRGFLFADGVYEAIRWYGNFFFDMDGHMARLKRSMREIRISWPEADTFPTIAANLIKLNSLQDLPVIVYLQVTRGVARRSHAFPSPPVTPTVYAFARPFRPDNKLISNGIRTILRKDIRWNRCDIKTIALLPNVLSFQEARENDCYECIFSRNGIITECCHSNVFFVLDGILRTHPESELILSGITRKNILRIAQEAGIPCSEEAVSEDLLSNVSEAFVTNTSFEIGPVISIDDRIIGEGIPGPVSLLLREKFDTMIRALKG
jgi:D-alanine transaminase